MDHKLALLKKLKPRKLRPIVGGSKGWYYIEDQGLCLVHEAQDPPMVYITWRQIEQALAVRAALSAGAGNAE